MEGGHLTDTFTDGSWKITNWNDESEITFGTDL